MRIFFLFCCRDAAHLSRILSFSMEDQENRGERFCISSFYARKEKSYAEKTRLLKMMYNDFRNKNARRNLIYVHH